MTAVCNPIPLATPTPLTKPMDTIRNGSDCHVDVLGLDMIKCIIIHVVAKIANIHVRIQGFSCIKRLFF